jgi:AbiV family abortive infection protein
MPYPPGVDDRSLERGFLEPITDLTLPQIESACEAAFENAAALLEEADLLRSHERCARAYYLAHIACEELGKLPILTALAVSVWTGAEVNWKKVDRALRSHESKIKQVLFMDSLQGNASWREGTEAYEQDLRRMRTYTDLKNASLYSVRVGGRFGEPNDQISSEIFDSLRGLAQERLRAFEAYLAPMHRAGGLEAFFEGAWVTRANDILERFVGVEGRVAFEEYERSGDETAIRMLFDRILGSAGDQEFKSPRESGPLAEERLAEERQRMRELTSRPPPDGVG